MISTCPADRSIAPHDAVHYADAFAATSVGQAPACLSHHILWSGPLWKLTGVPYWWAVRGLAALPCLAGAVMAEGVAKSEMPKERDHPDGHREGQARTGGGREEVLLALVEPTRKESGCLCYNLHRAKADKVQFMFYEQWASRRHWTPTARCPT